MFKKLLPLILSIVGLEAATSSPVISIGYFTNYLNTGGGGATNGIQMLNGSGTNTTFLGINFVGPVTTTPYHGETNLNWSTMRFADTSQSNTFSVIFSGSPVEGREMTYAITNIASTNINVYIPESFSIDDNASSTNVVIIANSYAELHWTFDGTLYKLTTWSLNDPTLVSLSESGYFSSSAATIDHLETTIASLELPTNYSGSLDLTVLAVAKTNTMTATWKKLGLYRNDSGTVTLIAANDISTIRSAAAVSSSWTLSLTTDGNRVLVNAFGDPIEPLNWLAQGFLVAYTNGPTTCSTLRDAQLGTTGGSFSDETFYWMGSKFQAAGTYTICTADLHLSKTGAPTGNLTAEIWSHNAINNTPDALIGTGSATVDSATLTGSETVITFSSMQAAITAGDIYWVILKGRATHTGTDHVNWHFYFLGSGTHASMASSDDGVSWSSVSEQSPFKFQLKSN